MDWQTGMNSAVAYIEENLAGEIDLARAARYTGCSAWEFQRLFSFIAQVPLGEYIRCRRLTLAAEDLRRGEGRVIEIALKYGYDSPASFSRAFSQWHGVPPSSARNEGIPLRSCPPIAFAFGNKERSTDMNDMELYSQRGYYVRENAPVYFTPDMDRTIQWFRDVLGWYGDVTARDEQGAGGYGCVFDYPGELIVAQLTPFRGIHLFRGEPSKGVVGFLLVQGLDRLHQRVRAKGWTKISDICDQPWGARECTVETPDGSLLRFFETTQA